MRHVVIAAMLASALPAAPAASAPTALVSAPAAASQARPSSPAQRLERLFLQITAANLRFQSEASRLAEARSNNPSVKDLAGTLAAAAWLLGADLAVAVVAMALTPVVKTPAFNATIPGFWIMGALLAWALRWHWKGGLAAAAVLSVTDLLLRDSVDQGNYGNVFLVLLGGTIVGYMCASLQRMAAEWR